MWIKVETWSVYRLCSTEADPKYLVERGWVVSPCLFIRTAIIFVPQLSLVLMVNQPNWVTQVSGQSNHVSPILHPEKKESNIQQNWSYRGKIRGCMKQSWATCTMGLMGTAVSMKPIGSVALGIKMLSWRTPRRQWRRRQKVATADSAGACLWKNNPFGDLSAGLTCLLFAWMGKLVGGVLGSQLRLSCWLGLGLGNLHSVPCFMQILSVTTSKPSNLLLTSLSIVHR